MYLKKHYQSHSLTFQNSEQIGIAAGRGGDMTKILFHDMSNLIFLM